MSLGPFIRTPFTDLTASVVSHQFYGRCAELELRMVECYEAYGLDRGKQKCADIIHDFQECALQKKQRLRIEAMRNERNRQYAAGERSKENRYAESPTVDSY